jgi:hypothetical protein
MDVENNSGQMENQPPSLISQRVAAWEALVASMREWAEKNLPPGHIVEDSRESIYEGRGE